jgi:hypothetical protein
MANTRLTRTVGAGNRQTWTWSGWVKRSQIGTATNAILGTYVHGNDEFRIYFADTDKISMRFYNGTEYILGTTRVFRDTNAWYHLVFVADTTNSTTNDRFRIYVNGTRETVFDANSQPTQNLSMSINDSNTMEIGSFNNGSFFNGSMSHINFIDGTAYDASAFGSTDATTGEWKIKTTPSVTYGTNGFFILKDGNSVTDQSSNTNNFTVGGGTLTKTEDSPSNVFATLNPLIKPVSSMSYSNANTTITTSGTQWEGSVTTIAPTSGKWYWEAKYNTGSGIKLDIARQTSDLRNMSTANNSYLAYHGDGYGYQLNNSGTDYYCADNSCTTWNSSINGNSTKIYMVAVDLDNGKMWIGANGTWANKTGTANPVTGDDPLHEFSAKLNGEPWLFSMSVEGGSGSHNANFGNGYFGTTAVSSAGTNASNLGIFEYDVPTGYTALCTKGLNE